MSAPRSKPAAQVAAARRAKKLKDESKAKFNRPPSDDPRRAIESDAPTAVPISASPRQPRGPPPRKFHLDKRIDSIVDAPGGDDDLLTAAEVAAWLGVSVQWVDIGRSEGYGPPFQKLGDRLVRYHRGKVRAWLLARTCYRAVMSPETLAAMLDPEVKRALDRLTQARCAMKDDIAALEAELKARAVRGDKEDRR